MKRVVIGGPARAILLGILMTISVIGMRCMGKSVAGPPLEPLKETMTEDSKLLGTSGAFAEPCDDSDDSNQVAEEWFDESVGFAALVDEPVWEDLGSWRHVLNTVTEERPHDLLIAIATHPREMPSLKELTFLVPKITNESTTLTHLRKLLDVGVVEKVTLDESAGRDVPQTFYTFTDEGRTLLDSLGLLPSSLAEIRELYRAMPKPDHIKRHEDARRPGDPEPDFEDADIDQIIAILNYLKETRDTDGAAEKWVEMEESPESGSVQSPSDLPTDVIAGLRKHLTAFRKDTRSGL